MQTEAHFLLTESLAFHLNDLGRGDVHLPFKAAAATEEGKGKGDQGDQLRQGIQIQAESL